jgi:DNA-binding PadR family transcriptional regulator
MAEPVRVTGPLLDVLDVFLLAFDGDAELHGWAIMKAVKRSGPTVYGVLDRLEDAGWISGRWEDQHPEPNKPRRRFYRLTPTGVIAARDLLTARRPQALARPPRPEPGLALLPWPLTLLPGGAR